MHKTLQIVAVTGALQLGGCTDQTLPPDPTGRCPADRVLSCTRQVCYAQTHCPSTHTCVPDDAGTGWCVEVHRLPIRPGHE